MDPLVAVYDACVLYPAFLRDFLVRLAIHGRRQGGMRARWTGRIHAEWIRANLRQRGRQARAYLLDTRRRMDTFVPGARVHGYQRWERRLQQRLPDEGDAHVLAAAIVCAADVIVTFNTRHFPANVLGPFQVEAISPDTFVYQLMDSGIVAEAAREHRLALQRPPLSPQEYLDHLRNNRLPGTAAALAGCPGCLE